MKEINLKSLVSDINKKKAQIVGFGYYTEGVHEYWKMLKLFIHNLAKINKNIDIYFEDVYPLVNNLNNLIHNPVQIRMGRSYNSQYKYPLKRYISNNAFDSIEFLDFINELQGLNLGSNDINIIGVNHIVEDNQYDQYQMYDPLKSLKKRYPQFSKDNSIKSKFIKSIVDLKENQYMYTLIDYLQKSRNRIGIFVGHVDSVQKFKLNGYKSVGYMLGKKYNDKYIAIGTASMGGIVRFVGRLKPSYQKNNTKIYEKIQYDKEPIGYKVRDRGSLQRTVKNMFQRKPYHIFKLDGKNSLYYYTSGKYKFSESENDYYRNIKHLNYLIYFEQSTPVHNLIFEETVYV